MKIRIPTKAQYSFLEFDSLEEFEGMTKESLVELVDKHNNACRIAMAQQCCDDYPTCDHQ